jgi:hypothetical protein
VAGEDILDVVFTFLHLSKQFAAGRMGQSGIHHLWDFNLHYFEYCRISPSCLSRRKERRRGSDHPRIAAFLDREQPLSQPTAWHPYPISLR